MRALDDDNYHNGPDDSEGKRGYGSQSQLLFHEYGVERNQRYCRQEIVWLNESSCSVCVSIQFWGWALAVS